MFFPTNLMLILSFKEISVLARLNPVNSNLISLSQRLNLNIYWVEEKKYLKDLQATFQDDSNYEVAIKEATSKKLHELFQKYPEKFLVNVSLEYKAYCDRKKARFSTWYEFFPRSASPKEGVHGTFKDCEALLPRVAKNGGLIPCTSLLSILLAK